MTESLPDGITGWEPMPYPYRRWNGTVWCKDWVDTYNRQLDRIRDAHEGNLSSVDSEVEALYRHRTLCDQLEKEYLDETLAAGDPLPERYRQV